MSELSDYQKALAGALAGRALWLEREVIPQLQDVLRAFQTAASSLYTVLLKKRIINADPYKNEAKISALKALDAGPFDEGEQLDVISMRLSKYDTQLDFLVNFYQLGLEFLRLDQIKLIIALIKYIDWTKLSVDSIGPNTRAFASLIVSARNAGMDAISMKMLNDSLAALKNGTANSMVLLKEISDYQREAYKLEIREKISGEMDAAQASVAEIKKKFAQVMPRRLFYADIIEEILKEDYSMGGHVLRENILKKMTVATEKPKAPKEPVSFRPILLEGLFAIAGAGSIFEEVLIKLMENGDVLENQRGNFWEKVKRLMQQALNREPPPVFYTLEYQDATRGTPVKEKINFSTFRSNMEKKAKILAAVGPRGQAQAKVEAMDEGQLAELLDRNIKDVQSIHKTLTALDDFFKAQTDPEDRGKIKGIKPDLSTIKNAFIKANQKRHEYSALKEEEEQFQRLGIARAE
jgi:hypothetical protein